jgi:uncharacterized membrane protein
MPPVRDRLLPLATAAYAVWFAVGAALFLTRAFPPAWAAAAGPWSDAVFLALAALVAFALARRDHGTRRAAAALLLVLAASAGAEVAGVNLGFPFGNYLYSDRLGPRALGMPLIIPFCWAFLILSAHAISCAAVRRAARDPREAWALSCLATAAVVTAFDLLLEPVAVQLRHYWVWLGRDGAWYGAPRLNFASWFALSLLLAAGAGRILEPRRWSLRAAAGAWLLLASVVGLFGAMAWRAGLYPPAHLAMNLGGLTALGLAWAASRPCPPSGDAGD